ncbi:MAG: fatty acid synthase subunit beta domain-containing protein, partial [Myxococcota bacterium]
MMVDDHLPGPDGESLNPDEVGSPRRTVLTFAGQAGAWLDELAQMSRESDAVRHLVDLTADFLTRMSERDAMAGSGVWARGIDVRPWFEGDRPDSGYLSHCSVSHPWIFATQIARWLTVRSDVLAHTEVIALTGHSQGVVPATFLAETTDLTVPQDRYLVWLEWLAWEGMHMQLAYKRKGATLHAEATPMAAIGRLPRLRLEPILARVNRGLAPDAQLSISLENTWDRTVISGPPESLVVLQDALGKLKSKDASDRRTPDPMPDFIWEWLAVSTPFHSRHMEPGLAPMRANLEEMAFKAVDKLAYTVLDPSNGEALPDGDARTEALLNSLFLEPVRWQTTMASAATLPGVTGLIDLGPGDGVARLTAATLRGTGLPVIAAATEAGRLHLAEGTTPHAVDWRPYAPRHITLPDGSTRIDNLWTRATGTPPVWLPGMTPTTVEVPLVAAAADAGYMAELAGGGQVTERHLRMRLDELAKTMKPGGRVVFNALYLDAYLWRLHLGEKKLVQKLAAAGAPLCGVTISAGIPPVDEAVALLEELEAVGLWMNAFKPGTVQQVDQVLRIAAQRPESTLFLHLEGGHAGGHHGWHGLEPVLLATYARIRRHRNVVLCVGGGVGDEARATELITGAWSQKYGVTRMPVDSVFLGTVTMACKEALTSPDVKRALVEAAGTPSWVKTHKVDGDITSGRSGLDADIYYLETSASRAGRLLDQVAGDADAAARRRDEIIEALSHTAKPYFGDLEAMTWHAVLNRIVELMAIGRNSPYEDGIWLDISWRQRFADALRRAEARVCDLDEGTFESRLQDPDLQDPHACVAGLLDAWPQIATHKLHPLDARWFVDSLCRRPGKPVPFVPVIDENVRKWYASDSLWQAHDPRYTADQVLAIPGPVAVSGIKKVDEPIGELLGRFVHGLTDALGEPAGRALRQPRLRTSSEGLTRGWTNAGLDIQAQEGATCWDAALTDVGGPVVDALLAEDGWAQGRRVPNPIRKLCEPRDGASLLIAEDGHTATWTFEDERVSLTASATGLTIAVHPRLAGEATVWSFDARLEGGAIVHDLDPSLAIFYPAALFGEALPEVPLFSTTRETVTVTPDRAEAYARVTGRVNPEGLASDLVFSLTWKPLFAALQACPEGMLRLVHLEHGVEVGPDGLPEPGESVEVSARLTRVEDGARGRTIHAIAQVDGGRRATLHAMFFVRGDASHTPWAVRALEDRSATLVIDGAAREFLATHDDITLTGELTDRVMVEVELGETRHRDGRADGHAIGTLFNGETVLGHIEMKGSFEGSHPIGAMIDALKADEATDAATPPLTLATVQDVAPVNPAAFARIGRDYNPIHVSPVMARFADLDGPIVHGLWSAARCTAFVVDHAADGDATRITHSRVQFLAPVAPG